MKKVLAVIPFVESRWIEIRNDFSEEEIKSEVCNAMEIEPEATTLTKRLVKITENDFNELKKEINILDKSFINKTIEIYSLDYMWARQLLLYGKETFRKIRNAKVMIVGAGALGNELAKNLAFSGVGMLKIVDYDDIENSNLSKTIFFTKKDIGKSKAQVIARKIKRMIPNIDIRYFYGPVQEINPLEFLEYDAIACCTDDFETRIYLNERILELGVRVPLFDAGVRYRTHEMGIEELNLNGVRIQNLLEPQDACFACTFSETQYEELEKDDMTSGSCSGGKVPSNINLMSLGASLQAEEILKYITKTGNNIKYVYINTDVNIFFCEAIEKNENCFICSKVEELPQIKVNSLKEIQKKFGKYTVEYQKKNRYILSIEKLDKMILVEVIK